MVKEITAYQSITGQMYPTFAEADRADGIEELSRMSDKLGLGSGGTWDAEMINSELIEHCDEYVRILCKISAVQLSQIRNN